MPSRGELESAEDWVIILEAMESHLFGSCDFRPGGLFTGVVECTSNPDGNSTLGSRIPDELPVFILSPLPLGKISIYDARVQCYDDLLFVDFTGDTWWHLQQTSESQRLSFALELAAGCGGMGIGSKFLGILPKVAVDNNPIAIQHLEQNQHGHVLNLDLLDLQTAKTVHQHFAGTPDVALFGFPCQPFSSQGLRQGSEDSRFQTFYGGMRVIFMTQCRTAVLECVPGAGQDSKVLHYLDQLCRALHWQHQDVELDLAQQWPCRRRRWWSLLMPDLWIREPLQPWLNNETFNSVGSIFKHWGVWAEPEEHALQLLQHEHAAYVNPAYGSDKRLLELHDTAATILHSYGSALTPCPCGCRDQPFHPSTLASRGLRGFFVKSRVTGMPRFLHPREAALLLGVPDCEHYGLPPRTNLALLGLIASPMQTVWVLSNLLRNHAIKFDASSFPAPVEWLKAYQHDLLKQAQHRFQVDPAGPLPCITLTDAEGHRLVIASATSCSVAQLLAAERINLGWNQAGGITYDGLRLPLQRLLDFETGPYALTVDPGSQERYRPTGQIMIALVHAGQLHVALLQPGQFLFEALQDVGLSHIQYMVDTEGKLFGADFRIWRSLRLTTLSPDIWPPSTSPPLCGNGPALSTLGLHEGQVWFALHAMLDSIQIGFRPLLLHPRECQALLNGTWESVLALKIQHLMPQHRRICCIFECDNHWALLWGELQAAEINWYYCDGLADKLLDQAGILAGKILALLNLDDWEIESLHIIPQTAMHTCGTIAILHVGLCLGLFGIPTEEDIMRLHHWLLSLCLPGEITGFGLNNAQIEQLNKLLIEHGVPTNVATDRAQQVIAKLGAQGIIEALTARNSWSYLKALASKPSVSLRLVHADELSKHVAATAKQKFGAAIPNAKNKKKTDKKSTGQPVTLDPAQLVLSGAGFTDSEDDVVEQIDFDQVAAEMSGVAICSLAQGHSFLTSSASVSSGPLALLTTEVPSEEYMKQHDITPMTFTATFKGTGEPVIVYGAMKQLGDILVKRVIPGSIAQPDVIETQVIKIILYRDEFTGSWPEFSEAPVRHISQAVPALQLCTGKKCGPECLKTHPPVDEDIDTILLEIWSRTFAKAEGQRSTAPDAQLFWVFARIPKFLTKTLLQISVPGLYIEPRTDEKGHDELYRVIWLSSRTLEEAQHACRTCLQALGLVRLRKKYGIRVLAEHEEAAFKHLKPDAPYIATQVQRIFQLFPLPHGLQKTGVVKLLEQLKWVAKPLQPGKSSSTAMSWQVGAAQGPPKTVFTAFSNEVLITELTKEQKPKPPPRFIASQKTQQFLRSEASSSSSAPASNSDPWWQTTGPHPDPWGNWQGTSGAKPNPGKQHVETVAGHLRTEMQTAIRKELDQHTAAGAGASAEVKQTLAETDQRFRKLESSMTELQAQGKQFNQWFGEMGQQMQATDAAVQGLQYTLSTHQNELTSMQQDIKAVPNMVNQTMQSALNQHKADQTNEFNDRFDRLEALLNKRSRTE